MLTAKFWGDKQRAWWTQIPSVSKVKFPAIFIVNRTGKGPSQCILHVSWEGLLLFYLAFCFVKKEDEDEEAEVPSETEAGEEGEVDVCTVERIPALCSRCELWNKCKCSIYKNGISGKLPLH